MSKEITTRSILKLALPVSLGQLGHVLTNVSDTVMLGVFDAQHLAAATFGFSVFVPLLVFCMGLTMGLTPIVSEKWARKEVEEVQSYFYNSGLLYYVVLLVFVVVLQQLIPYLYLFGQTETVTVLGGDYFEIVLYSLIPVMVFQHLRQFIEGLGNTQAPMYISLVGNLLNIGLNYILIFGHFGVIGMGIYGAAYATLISRILMCACLVVYVFMNNTYQRILFHKKVVILWMRIYKVLKMSLPIALQFLMEVGAFAFMAIIVGWIGEVQLAAHQLAISLASMTYIVISGLGVAGTILVSKYIGLEDPQSANVVVRKSLIITFVFMLGCALFFVLTRNVLPQLFLNDVQVINLVSALLVLTACFQVSDGIQATLIGLLRGYQDVFVPTLIAVLAYWVITLPVGYLLGVYWGYGVKGCWLAFVIGLVISSILLFWRITTVKKKFI